MASATGHEGQPRGLGLRLELAQGPAGPLVRLHAGPADLAPGLRLAALVAEPAPGEDGDAPPPPRPHSPEALAALREGPWRALEVRVEVAAEAIERACARLRGARIGGWPVDQVSVDLAGERAALTLTGPRDEGWPGLVQVELAARLDGVGVRVRAGRVWALAPLAVSGPALWAALSRRAAEAWPGTVQRLPGGLRIDATRAVGRALAAAEGRPPRTWGLRPTRLAGEGRGLRLVLARMVQRTGLEEHVESDMVEEPDDPLAGLRAALRAGARGRALAELERAPTPTHPGARRLTAALARVRAELLRFADPPGAAAAVRAWLAAAPDDPEAWWRVAVQRGRAGDAEGLVRALAALGRAGGGQEAALRRRAARAIVAAERLGARDEDGFQDMSGVSCPDAQATARRALALGLAADPAVPPDEVERGLQEALAAAAACPRRWCADDELRARVAAVVVRAGRDGPRTEQLLRRIAGEEVAGVEEAPAAEVKAIPSAPARARVAARGRAPAGVDVAAEVDSLVGVALALARRGGLGRLDAIVDATAERIGSPALLAATLRARIRARPLRPGVVLALGSLAERTGDAQAGRALAQLAAFMLPRSGIAVDRARLQPAAAGVDATAAPRAAIVEVLRSMVAETGGIRAPGQRLAPPDEPAGARLLALADEGLQPLRAALGLRLPVRVGRGGGPVGGVAIRNEREPAIVVFPALLELPPIERAFRLALAAVLVRGGLAVVLDPAGASLRELLAALAHLAAPADPPELPGARSIVRVWERRGVRGDRFAAPLRAALVGELRLWRQDDDHVARVAGLLRDDHVDAAARLAGAVDGALLAIGRDAGLLTAHDEAAAAAVLATDEARRLLRGLGLFERVSTQ